MNLSTFLLMLLALSGGAVLGCGLHLWWVRKKVTGSLKVPDKWPLTSRVLITNEEHQVLEWLRATFDDQLVMIKLPVVRFTVPVGSEKKDAAARWQELLNGVYCTFTVCTNNGNVVGCVDVPGKRGLSNANRDLKESLLSDCHIAYTVVRSTHLPKGSAMRAAFLGELEAEDQPAHQATRAGDSSFHADLDSFTQQKVLAAKEAALKELNQGDKLEPIRKSEPAGFNPDGTGAFAALKSSQSSPQWEDSFINSDESRPAKLS